MFAGFVGRNAAREMPDRGAALATSIGDLGWVAGSAALLLLDPVGLTRAGFWAVGGVAEVVLTFAVLQMVALRLGRPLPQPALR